MPVSGDSINGSQRWGSRRRRTLWTFSTYHLRVCFVESEAWGNSGKEDVRLSSRNGIAMPMGTNGDARRRLSEWRCRAGPRPVRTAVQSVHCSLLEVRVALQRLNNAWCVTVVALTIQKCAMKSTWNMYHYQSLHMSNRQPHAQHPQPTPPSTHLGIAIAHAASRGQFPFS
jgi:hypothetical protein